MLCIRVGESAEIVPRVQVDLPRQPCLADDLVPRDPFHILADECFRFRAEVLFKFFGQDIYLLGFSLAVVFFVNSLKPFLGSESLPCRFFLGLVRMCLQFLARADRPFRAFLPPVRR